MDRVFLDLLDRSLDAAYLALAVMGVRLLFRRAPKWLLCGLWAMVALRLVCPVAVEAPWSLAPGRPAETWVQSLPETAAPPELVIEPSQEPILPSVRPGETAAEQTVQEQPGKPRLSPAAWAWIWAAGAAGMLGYGAVSYGMLRRRLATAVPLAEGIKQSEWAPSPFVLGLFRPTIYLPFRLAEEDVAFVVAHERCHIRRGDHWWKPLGFLLLSLHWFNPVLWLAYVLLCRDIEGACDERVIRSMGIEQRRAYASALLRCSVPSRRITACPLAFGEGDVKKRIVGVMHYKKPAFWILLTGAVAAVSLAVLFLTDPVEPGIYLEEENGAGATVVYSSKKLLNQQTVQGSYRLEQAVPDGAGGVTWQTPPLLGAKFPMGAGQDMQIVQTEGKRQQVNWTENYGPLSPGDYRLGVKTAGDFQPEWLWAEFSVAPGSCAYTWIGGESGDLHAGDAIVLPGAAGVHLVQQAGAIVLKNGTDSKPIFQWESLDNVHLADLTGDGVAEVCASGGTFAEQEGEWEHGVAVYDWAEDRLYRLDSRKPNRYRLVNLENRLFLQEQVLQSGTLQSRQAWELTLEDGAIRGKSLDSRFAHLTQEVVLADIHGAQSVRLQNPQPLLDVLKKLDVQPGPLPELEAAVRLDLYTPLISRSFCLSQDLTWIWEMDGGQAYQIRSTEPLAEFLDRHMDVVLDADTSGAPFADENSPWDWAAGVRAQTVGRGMVFGWKPAELPGRDGTGYECVMTQEQLALLLSALNQIPKEKFRQVASQELLHLSYLPEGTDSRRSEGEHSGYLLEDRVNGLLALVRWQDGQVELLLTDQVQRIPQALDSGEPVQIGFTRWQVADARLESLLKSQVTPEYTIIPTVAAQYRFQEPVTISGQDAAMVFWPIKGWEYQILTGEGELGLRLRPAGAEGWVRCTYCLQTERAPQEDGDVLSDLLLQGEQADSWMDSRLEELRAMVIRTQVERKS